MIEAIDHVEVVTPNIERSIDFYTRILGFHVHERNKMDGSRGITEITYLKLGESMLELLEIPKAMDIADGPRVGVRMFALRVSDMDSEVERLMGLGVKISQPPRLLGASKRGEIKDPDGVSIEIRQW